MLDYVTHRLLRIPYTLHVRINRRSKHHKATVLFLHGIGNTGAAWDDVTRQLPGDLNIVTIDLLGFGNSRRPSWIRYSAKTQARSIMATFLKLRITEPVIVVGHSLGALVAVEIAKRYPLLVKSLVLCAPPFYRVDPVKFPNSDQILRSTYRFAKDHPEHAIRLATLAIKYGLVNKSFTLTDDKTILEPYMDALESSIINQTSLADAEKLALPVTIIRGRFDPVIVPNNLRRLAKKNPHIILKTINAGHEIITKTFVSTVVESITQVTHPQIKKKGSPPFAPFLVIKNLPTSKK